MKPEFSVEQIKAFVAKDYQSVSARYVKSALAHIEQLQKKIKSLEAFQNSVNEALNMGDGVYRP